MRPCLKRKITLDSMIVKLEPQPASGCNCIPLILIMTMQNCRLLHVCSKTRNEFLENDPLINIVEVTTATREFWA